MGHELDFENQKSYFFYVELRLLEDKTQNI